MKIEDILSKVVSGSELSEAEKSFLSEYRSGVPIERLNQEISKKKSAEESLANMQAKIDELSEIVKAKEDILKEKENESLTEQEKLQKQLDEKMAEFSSKIEALEASKIEAEKKLQEKEFSLSVNDIAKENKFIDSNYLAFMLKSKEIDINDSEALNGFISSVKESQPSLFKVENAGGSGSVVKTKEPTKEDLQNNYEKAKESGDVDAMLANAPILE